MNAEVLREAARVMRERARAATAYTDAKTGDPLAWVKGIDGWVFDRGAAQIACAMTDSNADHIASWHPAAALAVADLLDSVARTDLGRGQRETHDSCDVDCDVVRALTVARAYLGETS